MVSPRERGSFAVVTAIGRSGRISQRRVDRAQGGGAIPAGFCLYQLPFIGLESVAEGSGSQRRPGRSGRGTSGGRRNRYALAQHILGEP